MASKQKSPGRSGIEDILANKRKYYDHYKIPKKQGGFREIVAPKPELKYIQKSFAKCIGPMIDRKLGDNIVGFRKGKDIVDNAEAHLDKELIINIDIANFFPSIPMKWTEEFLYNAFNLSRVKNWKKDNEFQKLNFLEMLELLTISGKLCQGSPCSPMLANFYLTDTGFDDFLSQDPNWTYTRYADDLTLSTSREISRKQAKQAVKTVYYHLKNIELKPSFHKTKIRYKDQKQLVTGVLVNGKKVKIDTETFKRIKAGFHQHGITASNEGYLNYVKNINKEQSDKLLKSIKE